MNSISWKAARTYVLWTIFSYILSIWAIYNDLSRLSTICVYECGLAMDWLQKWPDNLARWILSSFTQIDWDVKPQEFCHPARCAILEILCALLAPNKAKVRSCPNKLRCCLGKRQAGHPTHHQCFPSDSGLVFSKGDGNQWNQNRSFCHRYCNQHPDAPCREYLPLLDSLIECSYCSPIMSCR